MLDDLLVWSRLEESNTIYKFLEVAGKTKYTIPLPRERRKRFRFLDPLVTQLPEYAIDSLIENSGPYYMADGDIPSYNLSVSKMDVKPVRNYEGTVSYEKAQTLVFRMLSTVFGDGVSRPHQNEEFIPNMNLNTSAGFPLCVYFKKKSAALDSRYGRQYLSTFDENYKPIWRVVAKQEWYHSSDIDAGKVRTFIIPPLKFLMMQLRFYSGQNSALKDFWWSAYGFNPYYGGTHQLALKLLKHNTFVYYDVRAWDRKFPHMKDVYNIRNSFFDAEFQPIVNWIADRTCHSYLLLADGTIVFKKISNNSGSGCTTPDNIIGHMLTLAFALYNLYDGDTKMVLSCIANLFGDDNLLSLPKLKFSHEHIEKVFRDSYLAFGWELDPFVIQDTLEGCEFLGFRFKLLGDVWVPLFNLGRITAAFCYEYDRNTTLDQQLSKAYSLMIMSWPHGPDVFNKFTTAYKLMLSTAQVLQSTNTVVKSYRVAGIPAESDMRYFYLGLEVSTPHVKLFRMEVVQKVLLGDYEQGYKK